jgi:hypothetical protein
VWKEQLTLCEEELVMRKVTIEALELAIGVACMAHEVKRTQVETSKKGYLERL